MAMPVLNHTSHKFFLLAICAFFSLTASAGAKSPKSHSSFIPANCDSIPKPTPKIVKSKTYNEKTKKVSVTYTDGTKETMTLEQAIKRKILPPPKVEMEKFTPPEIKEDEELMQDSIVVTMVDTTEGIVPPPPPPPPMKEWRKQRHANAATTPDDSLIFTSPEIDPRVDPQRWRRHLESQLGPSVKNAVDKKMTPGIYTIQVRFIVEKNGLVHDVKALNDPGYGLGAAAVEIIKKGPKWTPATQNGRIVRAYKTQPITFLIRE
jgi:hypothetical protein